MMVSGVSAEEHEVAAKLLARYEARVRVVKAMAHPTRMFIVDELSRVGGAMRLRTHRDGGGRHVHRFKAPLDSQERRHHHG